MTLYWPSQGPYTLQRWQSSQDCRHHGISSQRWSKSPKHLCLGCNTVAIWALNLIDVYATLNYIILLNHGMWCKLVYIILLTILHHINILFFWMCKSMKFGCLKSLKSHEPTSLYWVSQSHSIPKTSRSFMVKSHTDEHSHCEKGCLYSIGGS